MFDWLLKHWLANLVLVGVLIALVSAFVVLDLVALPPEDRSQAWIHAGLGWVAGTTLALLLLGGTTLVFPHQLTRHPERTRRNLEIAVPAALVTVFILTRWGGLDDRVGERVQLAFWVGFFMIVIPWRIWFEKSDWALKRWPASERRMTDRRA